MTRPGFCVLGTLPRMLRTLGGGLLFGELWGEPPPVVVVLHGWHRTHSDFDAVVGPASAAGPLPALAPDLPGFGATPPPPGPWGSEQYASAVARLFEEPGGPTAPAVVVGHSLGGRVAATLAARRPELVRSLVLTGAPLITRQGRRDSRRRARPKLGYRVIRATRRLHLVDESRMERARQRYGSEDYRSAQGVMRDVLVRLVNEDYAEVLAGIGCPVHLVWGERDAEVPPAVADDIRSLVPGADLTIVPCAGHLLPVERPDELRAAIERSMESKTESK
jgi:pimeloyl-ACP methyl ester carboxylesterase